MSYRKKRAAGKADMWVIGKSPQKITKAYTFGKQLGQPGAFGEAFLVTKKDTQQKLACKVISKAKFNASNERAYQYSQLRNEITLMRDFEHPNIIKFSDVFEDDKAVYIVMECCSGGELFDRIKAKPTSKYSEIDAAKVCGEILEGIKYLHDQKIAHCDLKPDNFLFIDPSENAQLKVIHQALDIMHHLCHKNV